MVNRALVIAYVHKKVRLGPEVATFKTKTLNLTVVVDLNWLAKIELRGPGHWLSIILLITFVRVYCCMRRCYKKLKLKKQGLFVTFLSLVAFQLGRGRALWAPLGYAYVAYIF